MSAALKTIIKTKKYEMDKLLTLSHEFDEP